MCTESLCQPPLPKFRLSSKATTRIYNVQAHVVPTSLALSSGPVNMEEWFSRTRDVSIWGRLSAAYYLSWQVAATASGDRRRWQRLGRLSAWCHPPSHKVLELQWAVQSIEMPRLAVSITASFLAAPSLLRSSPLSCHLSRPLTGMLVHISPPCPNHVHPLISWMILSQKHGYPPSR